MADDQDQEIVDPFESQLQNQINEEQSKVTTAENHYNARRSQLNNQMVQELLGTDKSYTAELNGLNQEVLILDEAINLMGLQDSESQQKVLFAGQLPARSNYSLPEQYDPDQAVMAWIDSLVKKTEAQQSLEDFVFGKKERVKIAQARTNKKFFDNYDLTQMKTIYVNEMDSRRELIQKAEDALLHLYLASGKGTLFPSQPNRELLNQLERDLTKYQARVTHHRDRLALMSRGTLNEKEIEKEARILAQEDLRREEEEEKPPVGAEPRRVPQEVAHIEVPVSRARPERPFVESNSLLARWKSFTQNPLGEIKKLFTSTRTATNVTKTVVAGQLGKQSFGMMLKKGGMALLARFGIGAATGGVGIAVLAAAEKLGKFIPGPIKEKLKDLASKLQIWGKKLILFLMANPLGLALGSMASFLLTPLGPAAMAAGFGAGFFAGFGLQGVVANILGIGSGGTASFGAAAPAASISIGGFTIPAGLSSAVTSIGGILGGSGITTFTLVGIGGGLSALLLSVTLTLAAVLQTPEEQQTNQGQSQEVIFTLKKESLTPEFPVYDEGPITVQYKLAIQQQKNPITVLSITDKFTRSNSSSWSQNLSVPALQNTYFKEISGPEFKNTYLYNLVTVKVKDNVTGQEETKTASAQVKIGQPMEQKKQPYGYPVGGVLTTVDVDVMPNGGYHSSCFMNFVQCQWFNGGLDIAPGVGDHTVKATMAGKVIKSKYDRSSSPLSDVGGVVYIQSDDGLYISEYMHLDQDGLISQDKIVSRGEIIGKIYDNPSNKLGGGQYGAHLHYQVLFNNANLLFNDALKVGNCSEGKYLEALPVQWQTVPTGPFVCQ